MPFISTPIEGLLVFEPKVVEDSRGYFYESFNARVFEEVGITNPFVQDNQSRSSKGVLRGLHYQLAPYGQAKLVRVISGEVLDVAVDIRKDSPSFGQHFSINLSAANKKQLYIPRGFAHGFLVLSETAEFVYKCDGFYNREAERGLFFNDPALGIDWAFDLNNVLLSEKDKTNPLLKNVDRY